MTNALVIIFGALGVIGNIVIYQLKSGKKILLSKLVSDISWTLHYIFLAAFSGAAIAGIGIIRDCIFVNKDKKWAQSSLWLWLFLILSVVSAYYVERDFLSASGICLGASYIQFMEKRPDAHLLSGVSDFARDARI